MNFHGPIQGDIAIAGIHNRTGSTTNFYFAGSLSQVVTVSNANTRAGSNEASNSKVFAKPTRFVGRGDELQELQRRLLVDKEFQKIAIFGLGGIGMTQIALEFAQSVKNDRPE